MLQTHGGTCGLSLPVGLALLHLQIRRRCRSHFYSLQTARQGEQNFWIIITECRERKEASADNLTYCSASTRDLITKKSDLDSKVKLCYPRPFVKAVWDGPDIHWCDLEGKASFFMLFKGEFEISGNFIFKFERSENFSFFFNFSLHFWWFYCKWFLPYFELEIFLARFARVMFFCSNWPRRREHRGRRGTGGG